MKYSCEVIKDLIPLYVDNVCSKESKEITEEHLKECNDCSNLVNRLKNTQYEDELKEEKNSVVNQYNKRVKRKAYTVGICIASVLMIPVIICLIVNLATGHSLDWFFIVLSSLLLVSSITVLPLMLQNNRTVLSLSGFTASLLILLLTCCIYTGGRWFFVAATACLFGLMLIFLPIILYRLPKYKFLANHKGLICMSADTILLFAMLLSIGLSIQSSGYWFTAFSITSIHVIVAWIVFAVIRYLKTNGLIKAGICTAILSAFVSVINNILNFILNSDVKGIESFNFQNWGNDYLNGNIMMLVLIVGIVFGLSFVVAGIIKQKQK